MKNYLFILLILAQLPAFAQDWLTQALAETGSTQKAKLDSIDFQFAMSVNENSSFLDIQQKGEGWTKEFILPLSSIAPQGRYDN